MRHHHRLRRRRPHRHHGLGDGGFHRAPWNDHLVAPGFRGHGRGRRWRRGPGRHHRRRLGLVDLCPRNHSVVIPIQHVESGHRSLLRSCYSDHPSGRHCAREVRARSHLLHPRGSDHHRAGRRHGDTAGLRREGRDYHRRTGRRHRHAAGRWLGHVGHLLHARGSDHRRAGRRHRHAAGRWLGHVGHLSHRLHGRDRRRGRQICGHWRRRHRLCGHSSLVHWLNNDLFLDHGLVHHLFLDDHLGLLSLVSELGLHLHDPLNVLHGHLRHLHDGLMIGGLVHLPNGLRHLHLRHLFNHLQ
mmetsp:Transcript_52381/g.168812  ORF Transcript_52381/g.168812 Transcript_52381/m.168812 type:complete len:299 (+) Transcript_52381:210-1106(+)